MAAKTKKASKNQEIHSLSEQDILKNFLNNFALHHFRIFSADRDRSFR